MCDLELFWGVLGGVEGGVCVLHETCMIASQDAELLVLVLVFFLFKGLLALSSFFFFFFIFFQQFQVQQRILASSETGRIDTELSELLGPH